MMGRPSFVASIDKHPDSGGTLEGISLMTLLIISTLAAGLFAGAAIYITAVENRLFDPSLPTRAAAASVLLRRWGRLHAVRSLLAAAAFVILLTRLAAR